jgi:hypothetical protein
MHGMCRAQPGRNGEIFPAARQITFGEHAELIPKKLIVARKLLRDLGMPQKDQSKPERKTPSKQEGHKQEARGKQDQDVSAEPSTNKKSNVRKGGKQPN